MRLLSFSILGSLAVLPDVAQAELTICNRTSYIAEAAVGIERNAQVSTRGWFRVVPGECRRVLDEPPGGELIYLHTRTPALYGSAPQPQHAHGNFCVGERDFTIANARSCRPGQQPAAFTAIKPADTDKGPVANLAEESGYSDEQARLAGIQRLLVIAGYDANPIDGVKGAKTEAALARFLKDRRLDAAALDGASAFETLLKAADNPQGHGFAWCNDTDHAVMAALGVGEQGGIVTRGWYRVEAGKCLRPDLRGDPRKLYSYAEAVDADGRIVRRRDNAPMAWGGDVSLCTRAGKFELGEHKDCAARGFVPAGFAPVELAGNTPATIRFTDR